jgi:hypothetical protein
LNVCGGQVSLRLYVINHQTVAIKSILKILPLGGIDRFTEGILLSPLSWQRVKTAVSGARSVKQLLLVT